MGRKTFRRRLQDESQAAMIRGTSWTFIVETRFKTYPQRLPSQEELLLVTNYLTWLRLSRKTSLSSLISAEIRRTQAVRIILFLLSIILLFLSFVLFFLSIVLFLLVAKWRTGQWRTSLWWIAISNVIVDSGVLLSKNNDGITKSFRNPFLNSILTLKFVL